ncbi:hypothetical protein PV325_007492, partial [Microctonus aethiopoides]
PIKLPQGSIADLNLGWHPFYGSKLTMPELLGFTVVLDLTRVFYAENNLLSAAHKPSHVVRYASEEREIEGEAIASIRVLRILNGSFVAGHGTAD